MQNNYDAIIIGGGPAGCSASVFIARCRWNSIVIDRSMSGSFLGSLGNVSYFPGVAEAISGGELLMRMRRQSEQVGVHFMSDAATAVTAGDGGFRIVTDSGKEMGARAVVVATGAASRTNYMPGEREFMGRGVSHDVLADGPAVAKRVAAVIGKTRHAAEEAIALTRFAERVHFIIPSSKLEADDALVDTIQKNRAIEIHFSTSLKKINGSNHVNSITVFTGGQEKDIAAVGVFTYMHEHRAATAFLGNIVELSASGAVKVDKKLATSADGIFACGDVLCGRPQMPAIAASQGLLAGISVDRYLSSKTS